ncbi:PREDICTED: craniofacial development protein 2-like [Nicotiana attenuata]|uniref:craniofacial development protein 2-like n=1 Tax=Nicotiana attenuata TaxID=49451 RepID=UPI0009058AED|nr:PREDICTED: craniofacial development protein 2-like [Nicotiana attenuata]
MGGRCMRKSSKASRLVGTRSEHRVLHHREYTKSKVQVIFVGIGSCPRGGRVTGRGLRQGSGGGTGSIEGKGNNGAYRLRIGSWNIGTLTGKSIELTKIPQKRKVNIACVHETRWIGSKVRNANGYKLWYFVGVKGKNGVGILVDRELRELVVEVRHVSDRLMTIKLVVGGSTVNVISAYAQQVSLDDEVKRRFWEALDEVVWGTPPMEKLFIGGDFNGHIGSSTGGYGEVHCGFDFGLGTEEALHCWILIELLSW